jgi:hypothetical protein
MISPKNKPNSNPNKPNLSQLKPKQTQNKANSNPISNRNTHPLTE